MLPGAPSRVPAQRPEGGDCREREGHGSRDLLLLKQKEPLEEDASDMDMDIPFPGPLKNPGLREAAVKDVGGNLQQIEHPRVDGL